MTKSILLVTLLLLSASLLHAQYNLPQSRIWAMGNKVGLDFSNLNNPVPIATNLANSNEAAASICDSTGQLLFYTNGGTVWNRNGVQMPNGAALTGTGGSTLSTAQGAVIVPVPDSAGKYYLFSLTAASNCKLYCNKIDMSLDGGMGDVVLGFPLRLQSLADSFLTEKMTPVAGCNNSVWLMVHTQAAPVFRAYHITAAGINLTPVISPAGNFAGSYYQQGVIKFSPGRTRMLNTNFRSSAPNDAGLEVFDFDYQTGVVSNATTLHNGSYYGAAFSPDGTKAYAGTTAVLNTGSISQWDLSAASPAASKTVLGPCGQYTDLKLGPDGRIYFGALIKSNGFNNYRFMGRINAPNLSGSASNFQDSVSSLIFPHATNANIGILSQGLPNDVAVPAPSTSQYARILDTTICTDLHPVVLTATAGYLSHEWDNGDTATSRTVLTRGTYWVRSTSACNVRVDTFTIGGANMPSLAIIRNGQMLTATSSFSAYKWYMDGQLINTATASSYVFTQNGIYSVQADFGSGCSDSVSYLVEDAAGLPDQAANPEVAFFPNPTTGRLYFVTPHPLQISVRSLEGKEIIRSINATDIDLTGLPNGMYVIVLNNRDGVTIGKPRLIHLVK